MLWTPWYPLNGASRNQDIPRAPGLYRIRRVDIPGLDYVGQTGVLRQRMGNLNNVYGDVMPYNAPHTAGPGFWALRQDHDCEFEVSVALDALPDCHAPGHFGHRYFELAIVVLT